MIFFYIIAGVIPEKEVLFLDFSSSAKTNVTGRERKCHRNINLSKTYFYQIN